MLSDATGVRAYAGVMPARMLAQMHQSGYGACKDAAGRANIAETRHLPSLWRITSAPRLVAKDCEQRYPRRGTSPGWLPGGAEGGGAAESAEFT
jgi:hypothetical protein